MRSKDIRIGQRYVARYCGAIVIVKVESIFQPSKIGESTYIVATNQATGQRASFQNALGIIRPAGHYIVEVETIRDLFVGEIAVPEPSTRYCLRRVDESECFATVVHVVRRRDGLYARTDCGKLLPITGQGAYVLVPAPV